MQQKLTELQKRKAEENVRTEEARSSLVSNFASPKSPGIKVEIITYIKKKKKWKRKR